MIRPYWPAAAAQMMAFDDPSNSLRRPHHRSRDMKWETPEATDMRFGMEITMYISNR